MPDFSAKTVHFPPRRDGVPAPHASLAALAVSTSGKVPDFSAKTVHFPPRSAGVPPPQASLAALAVSTPGESAGFSCENGSLSPVACRGTGSTGLSRRTHRFHLPGKCRVFPRKWFTFPRGRMGYRLHMPLWRHLPFPPPGKCREFRRKRFTFPENVINTWFFLERRKIVRILGYH